MRMGGESTAESLCSESEKKENPAHPTTDNANVTDVEEEDANSLARASASGKYRLLACFFISASSSYSTRLTKFS